MNLRIVPIGLRIVLAVSVPLVALGLTVSLEARSWFWPAVVVMLCSVGFTFWTVRSILEPLHRLTERATDLADGRIEGPPFDHGDSDAMAGLGRTLEDVADGLRHLGRQFEAMADGDVDDPSLNQAVPGLVGDFVQDWVAEVRQAADDLKNTATRDDLTGLLNHKGLGEALGRMAGGPEIAVVLLNLDRFDAINTEHGRQHGDAVLKVVARRLQGLVREDDPVSRIGGDEFVLLVSGVERQDMPIFVSRLELGLSEPISFEGTAHSVGCSVGVGWLGPDDLLEPILTEADQAMLEAKADRSDRIPR